MTAARVQNCAHVDGLAAGGREKLPRSALLVESSDAKRLKNHEIARVLTGIRVTRKMASKPLLFSLSLLLLFVFVTSNQRCLNDSSRRLLRFFRTTA